MSMRFVLFLSRLLSFRYIALGLLLARLTKYFVFGIHGFGEKWLGTPPLTAELEFIWDHCMMPYL